MVRFLFSAILVIFSLNVLAESPPQSRDKISLQLDRIGEKIEQAEKAREEITEKLAKASRELNGLNIKIKVAKAEEKKINLEIQLSEQELEEAAKKVKIQQDDYDDIVRSANSRLKAMYTHSDNGMFSILLFRTSSIDLHRNTYYLSKVREHDLEILKKLRATLAKLNEAKDSLKVKDDLLRGKKDALNLRLDSTKKDIADVQGLTEALKKDEIRLEDTITKLKSSAEKLNYLLSELTLTLPIEPVIGTEVSDPFELGAVLTRPVAGKIIRQFGASRISGLSDTVMNKGVEISSQSGSEVRAISGGKIIYIGKMPLFGGVVVLDHGKRSFSVYGRIEPAALAKGALVAGGSVLGKTSNREDGETTSVYFEVRRNGVATDPSELLEIKK